ncbi:MAG: outer membrane protein transport protein [Prevotellaceae bacterium]|jgi:hypothetical protein|nr:outer membrane protein transport protein [Prevotellaceae bacterium]
MFDDILKVSYQDYEGTARFAAMGGAFGALGGDISSIGVNPAGLAVFRKSHVSFTSSLNNIYNNSSVAGIQTDNSRIRAGISSLGAVIVVENQDMIKWNIGISYLKKTNFNRRTAVKSIFNDLSIIDYFSEKANDDKDFFAPSYISSYEAFYDYNPLDWDVVMAYGTYLIDWDKEKGKYVNVLDKNDRGVYQQINSLTKGSSGETTIDIGVNCNDKFFAGILLGMTTLNYGREVVYREYAHEDNISDFDRLTYNTNLKIRGLGLNYKIGVIYKPVQTVRLGLAFHSPDYLMYPYSTQEEDSDYPSAMDNLYSASMEVKYKSENAPLLSGSGGDYYLFVERIKTPYKATGSLAFVFGQFGLVSMDCEYVDYSRIKLTGYDPTNIFNSDIKLFFKNTVNLRFGAEIWMKNFALRAGYRFNQSPDKEYDLSRRTYSAGIGWRFKQFNVDMAYIQTNTVDYYTHYKDANKITENLKNRRFALTLGWTIDD